MHVVAMMSQPSPILITNAKILTMNPANPRAEAILLKDGRIAVVGSRAEVEALKTTDTRIIDAGGNTVLPGLSENHLHLFSGSAELDHLQLKGVEGFDALKQAAQAYAGDMPNETVLFGQGADYTILGDERVTRHHLDRIISDCPFVIFAPDHHTAWANTKALELADLLHGKQLGPGNEVVMGDDGLATGELREMEAFGPLQSAAGFDRYRLGLWRQALPYPL